MSMSLAVKYRPKKFDEVVEQSATKIILKNQLDSGDIQNAYLFCGGAGTGKTTCARIFANEINKGKGVPVELDAASNNSVDDVRDIIKQSRLTALDGEYNIFILDEVHALSNQAWQAMLKVLEEPPAKSIFIMCTTDPQKIPKTILSRVQRYNFQRISQKGIVDNLDYILKEETCQMTTSENRQALEFITKQAQGGMRNAITMLDKCLAYSVELTLENVIEALGISSYDVLANFLDNYDSGDTEEMIRIINDTYMSGKDLKQFIKDFTNFVLDYCKYSAGVPEYMSCPLTETIKVAFDTVQIEGEYLLSSLINLQNDIKWDTNPLARVEAWCFTKE